MQSQSPIHPKEHGFRARSGVFMSLIWAVLAVVLPAVLRRSAALVALVILSATPAYAHTVSYGYVAGTQPGQYTFWFGTYHTLAGFGFGPPYTQGSLQLACAGVPVQTVTFTNVVTALPAGLVKGTNYFYDAGYGGEPGSPLYVAAQTHTANSVSGPVATWQGVTFNNITTPGTCTFKYIPIANPSNEWNPNGGLQNGLSGGPNLVGVGGGSFQLTEGITIKKTAPTTTIAGVTTPLTTFSQVGQVINYSYAVTNTGNMVLTGTLPQPANVTLSVADNKTTVSCPAFGPLAGTSPVIFGLATNATLTCTASYTITQADIDAGSVTNTATATSGTSTTPYTSPAANATVNAGQAPSMTVAKDTNPASTVAVPLVKKVGDTVAYNYVVTNTGNTTLTSAITITDNKIPGVTCGALPTRTAPLVPGLAPNGTLNCTGTYTITQADLDLGTVTNTANSVSGPTKSPTVTKAVSLVQSPALTVGKSATVPDITKGYSKVGDAIPYKFVVTNTGNVTLTTAVTVTDNVTLMTTPVTFKSVAVVCPSLPAGGLAPNGTLTCNATYIVTQADLDAGSVTNIATAASGTAKVPSVTSSNLDPAATVTVTAVKLPALTVAKNTTTASYSSLPTTVPYTFKVTNTGNVSLAGPFTVTDPLLTTQPNCTSSVAPAVAAPVAPATLAPLASFTCTGSYNITQADLDAGKVVNTATVTAPDPNGPTGALVTATGTHTLPASQVHTLGITKSGAVSGPPAPAVAGQFDAIGQTITYTYVVTNTGNITIPATATFKISDNKLGTPLGTAFNCSSAIPPAGLPPSFGVTPAPAASTLTCSATHAVTQADIDAGSIINSATVTDGTVTSSPGTATVIAHDISSLSVVKSSDYDAVGATPAKKYSFVGEKITYTFAVTNTGNTTETAALSISDTKIASISCPSSSNFLPGTTLNCTASYTVTQADLDAGTIANTAFAKVGSTVSTPPVTHTVSGDPQPALSVTKTPDPGTYDTVGQTVVYRFVATNTGNVTIHTQVVIVDAKIPTITCAPMPAAGLAPNVPAPTAPATSTLACQGNYTITQADLDLGYIDNSATAQSGPTVSTPPTTNRLPVTQVRSLTTAKSAFPTTYSAPGTLITYTYVVKNTGKVTIPATPAVTINDNPLGAITCPSSAIAPGGTLNCSATYTTTQNDLDNTTGKTPGGTITNTATSSYTYTVPPVVPTGSPLVPGSTVTVTSPTTPPVAVTTVLTSSLTIGKVADTATFSAVGIPIKYTYTVKNTGNTTLAAAVTVVDNKFASPLACAPAGLAPGAVVTCSQTYTTTQADVDGDVTNTATANSGATKSAPASVTIQSQKSPALAVTKSPLPATTFVLGDVITYTFTVTNTGNTTITNPITITDPKFGATPFVCAASPNLAPISTTPAAKVTCTGTYKATQADVDAGSIVNNAFATSGTTVSPTVTNTLPGSGTAGLSIVKSATKLVSGGVTTTNPTAFNAAGDVVTYSFAVTNSGTLSLTSAPVISDSKITSPITCSPATLLGPSQTATCTGTYTVTQADLDNGSLLNTASATANVPKSAANPTGTVASPTSSVTLTTTQSPGLSVVKTAAPTTYNVGDIVPYTFMVTNSGNTTLTTPVKVVDAKVPTVVCDTFPTAGGAIAPLAPGAKLRCTGSYTLTQADLDAGFVDNTALATSTPFISAPTPTVRTPIPQVRSLSTAKSASPTTYSAPGTVITYSYVVTNTGKVTIPATTPVSITDNKLGTISCPAVAIAPSAFITCQKTYTTTQADLDNASGGKITNTASSTYTYTPPLGGPPVTITSPTTAPVDVTATLTTSFTVDKTTDVTGYKAVGDPVVYTITVTNTGNTTIATPVVTDPNIKAPATITCLPAVASLAPAAVLTCTAPYKITQSDLDAGKVVNIATATSTPPSGPAIVVTSPPHTLPGTQNHALAIAKSGSPATFSAPGVTITYTYAVTNKGNTTLPTGTVFSITDDKPTLHTFPCDKTVLAPGLAPNATLNCQAAYVTTQADVDAGSIQNTATATDGIATSPPITATVTATQTPSLTVGKSSDHDGAPFNGTFTTVGEVIKYSFLVTNTGNVTQTAAVTISDTRITTPITCTQVAGGLAPSTPPPVLPAKSTLTCTGSYTITQADIDAGTVVNSAAATSGSTTSTPPTPHTLTASKSPALTLVKSSDHDGPPPVLVTKLGEPIVYSYLVTNTGNTTLTSGVTITDDKIPGIVCPAIPATGLPPGPPQAPAPAPLAPNSLKCTATYSVTQADLDLGSITNNATAFSGAVSSPIQKKTVNATQTAKYDIAKDSTATNYSVLGSVIPYTYTVKNTGNVTLTGTVTITDDKFPLPIQCPGPGPTTLSLAPGSSLVCQANYTVTQADLDNGKVTNIATATVTPATGPALPPSAPATKTITGTPIGNLTMIKSTAATTFTAAGQSIPYTYTVTNAGNFTIKTAITVTDDKIKTPIVCDSVPPVAPAIPIVAPLATLTCKGTYITTQADVDAGTLTNIATAKNVSVVNGISTTTVSNPATFTLSASQAPGLTVGKTSTTSALLKAGQVVSYSYTITNTGNTTLAAPFTVSDDKIVAPNVLSCVSSTGGALAPTLAPKEFYTCSANYTVTQADIDAGSVTNTASATATSPTGPITSPKVPLTIKATQNAALTLDKTSSSHPAPKQFSAVGESIIYNFKVTNTGNVTLTAAIGINDILLTEDVGCPPPNPSPGGLKPGEFVACTGVYTVTQADMDAGFVKNTAFAVSGLGVTSPSVSLIIPGNQKSIFTIAKTTTSPTAVNNGNGTFTASFSVKVANTGNTDLAAMQVSDDYASGLPAGAKAGAASILSVVSSTRGALTTANTKYDATSANPGLFSGTGETLAPGEDITVTFTITFAPGINKSGAAFTNTVAATVNLPNGTPGGLKTVKTASATVPFVENHPLVVTKTTPKTDVMRGELVPYTISARNDYDPKLTDISITDLIPAGFQYKVGSGTLNGLRKEPTIAGRLLTWTGLTVEKGKPFKITLILIAGAGLGEGEFTNQAYAATQFGDPISNVATATVRIIPDPTFDCTDIIGRVFDDANRNGVPDEGERGLANVRLVTVRGQLITTDAEGRFHIACADVADSDRGTNYILKLDERTLPTGYRVTSENPRVIRITRGKMAKINFGASLHRVVRLDIADSAFDPGTTRLTQKWFDGLEAVLTPLKQERSVLRIAYRRTANEDAKLALERIRALQLYLLETWKKEGAGYELSIETEVYADRTAAN